MKPATHTIAETPWENASVGVRLACEAINIALWPLGSDDRMTVLLSSLANRIGEFAHTDDEIEAVIDLLRLTLKARQPEDSPPIQNY